MSCSSTQTKNSFRNPTAIFTFGNQWNTEFLALISRIDIKSIIAITLVQSSLGMWIVMGLDVNVIVPYLLEVRSRWLYYGLPWLVVHGPWLVAGARIRSKNQNCNYCEKLFLGIWSVRFGNQSWRTDLIQKICLYSRIFWLSSPSSVVPLFTSGCTL